MVLYAAILDPCMLSACGKEPSGGQGKVGGGGHFHATSGMYNKIGSGINYFNSYSL